MQKRQIGVRARENIARCFTLICVAVMLAVLALGQKYSATHYEEGTFIDGEDCSELTIEEAKQKLEEKEVVLAFADGSQFSVSGDQLGRRIYNTAEFDEFLMKQRGANDKCPKDFELSNKAYSVDFNTMKSCLESVMKQCKISVNKKPENAYIQLGADGYIEIVPEVQGNFLKIDDATNFAAEKLRNGENFILFTPVTKVYPEIRTNNAELALKADELNKILGAKIEYTLSDRSIYTLDHEITRKWLKQDDSGEFYINLEEELDVFLKGLNQKVQELGATMEFIDREGNTHYLPVEPEYRNSLDIEAEKISLRDEIEYGGSIKRDPIYSRFNSIDTFTTRAEVWREKQLVYFYIDGECVEEVNGAPCVTGTANTSRETPLGVFFVLYMQSPKEFKTYGGRSTYWVQFTKNGIGFHDATWRAESEFVPETYLTHGSHGCVNEQYSVAKFTYEHSYLGMPVLVY